MIWQARAAEVSYLYLSRTCDVVSQVCMQIGEMGTGQADCEAAAGDGLCSVKTKVSSEMAREKLKKNAEKEILSGFKVQFFTMGVTHHWNSFRISLERLKAGLGEILCNKI